MICDNCKIDRLVSDFINNQKFCYRCVYREKLKKATEKRTEDPAFCRICGGKIASKPDEKKRQRTVFCSCGCAEKGHKEQLHWTRRIRTDHFYSKKERSKWNTDQK